LVRPRSAVQFSDRSGQGPGICFRKTQNGLEISPSRKTMGVMGMFQQLSRLPTASRRCFASSDAWWRNSLPPILRCFRVVFTSTLLSPCQGLMALIAVISDTGMSLVRVHLRAVRVHRREPDFVETSSTDGGLFGSGHLKSRADTLNHPMPTSACACSLPSSGYTLG